MFTALISVGEEVAGEEGRCGQDNVSVAGDHNFLHPFLLVFGHFFQISLYFLQFWKKLPSYIFETPQLLLHFYIVGIYYDFKQRLPFSSVQSNDGQ